MPLSPEQASNFAPQVDNLVYFLLVVCLFFATVICAAVIYFMVKYRRKTPDEIGVPIH
jgi:cytochrome c oxidase subunit 2